MKAWDSHCHLQLDPLFEQRESVLAEALKHGVAGCLVPSYSPEEWPRQTLLARDSRVRNALGVHPWCITGADSDRRRARLEEAFQTLPALWGQSLVAVGECGLDRSRPDFKESFELQIELFSVQLEWAHKLELPVIVHSVRATGQTLEMLRDHAPPKGGVLHSYLGSPETVPAYLELGMRLSYSGTLEFSEKARRSLLVTPEERLLWETDGPFGKGLLEAGRPVGPQNLPKVVELASQILGKSKEWCWSAHSENMADLFGIQEIT